MRAGEDEACFQAKKIHRAAFRDGVLTAGLAGSPGSSGQTVAGYVIRFPETRRSQAPVALSPPPLLFFFFSTCILLVEPVNQSL